MLLVALGLTIGAAVGRVPLWPAVLLLIVYLLMVGPAGRATFNL